MVFSVTLLGAVVVVWWLYLQLPLQSVPITINAVSQSESRLWRAVLDTTLCDKFSSDLRQLGGFYWVRRFSPSIKLIVTI